MALRKSNPLSKKKRRQQESWLRGMVMWETSVIPLIASRVLFTTFFAVAITVLHERGVAISFPFLSSVVPSVVLALLLVFRTNTAYERFWEGRKLWGQLINACRNLAVYAWTAIAEHSPEDRERKVQFLRLLTAYAIALKLLLRQEEEIHDELAPLLPPGWDHQLRNISHPPLRIAVWMGQYLEGELERHNIDAYQLAAMNTLRNQIIDVMGGCERILRTPIPPAYAIHLKQLSFLYCLSLPFQVVGDLGWWTFFVVGLISFAILGIEAIGLEIENPFGHDPNDLKLDDLCTNLRNNIENIILVHPPEHSPIPTPPLDSILES